MFVEIVEAGAVAANLIENRRSILDGMRWLRKLVLAGRLRIPVLGDGGTGKTTLGKFLAGELDTSIALPAYRQSIVSETRRLPGATPCVFLIAPGQPRKRQATWPEFYRLLAKGKAPGVINVVAYGYHGTELEQQRHETYQSGMNDTDFAHQYAEHNRQQEIAVLNELAPHLEAAEGRLWMITLVMKQDLWWPSRAQVAAHYMDGEYNGIIAKVTGVKGAEHFTHHYYSASLIPENLNTRDGKLIARTAAGFDQPLRLANLNHFVQGLRELIG